MSEHPPLPQELRPDEDLGAPGPGDDAAHRHSYLYEHVIDALVIFAARYIRTALLLARRPSRASDALLQDLDAHRGQYTRPLAFLAISYMLFVGVLGFVPEVGRLIGEGNLHVDTGSLTASSLNLNLSQLFAGFGEAEADYLVVAILAPLPAVVLVSMASNLASGLLGGASEYSRSRFAMLVQYSVGLSLFSLVWLMVQTVALGWGMVQLADAYEHSGGASSLFVAIVAMALFFVGMFFATGALILAISVMPVWRVQKVLPDLASLGVLRRAVLSLAGPTVLVLTLSGISKMVELAQALDEPPVSMHLVKRLQQGDRVSLQGAVRAGDEGPVAITDWRLIWRGTGDHETGCEDLDRAGRGLAVDLPAGIDTSVEAVVPTLVETGPARLVEGVLYLDAGEAAWVRVDAIRPSLLPVLTGRGPAWRLCGRTSRDRLRWVELAS